MESQATLPNALPESTKATTRHLPLLRAGLIDQISRS